MANYIVTRTTSQQISETRNIRDVDNQIAWYDPDVAPLITFLNRLKGRRKQIKSTKHEWFERDYVPVWGQNGTATVAGNTNSTTITVSDGTKFIAGDLFVLPKASSSSSSPEMGRVTAVTGNVLTVIRDVGSAGVDTILPSAAIRIIGSAHEEHGAFPGTKSSQSTAKYTYTQIERTACAFSRTAHQVVVYGTGGKMSDRDLEHIAKMVEHKRKLNDTLLWGRVSQDLTGGPNSRPIRTTMGLRSQISTNVTDISGMLTRKKFANFARDAFRYGAKRKLLVVAPIIKQAINEWGVNFLGIKPSERKFGVSIQEVETAHGVFMLVNDYMLEDGVSGQNGFGHVGFAVDVDMVQYLYLMDTKVEMDKIKTGVDGFSDEIITEYAYKIKLENRHSMMYGVTDYMQ